MGKLRSGARSVALGLTAAFSAGYAQARVISFGFTGGAQTYTVRTSGRFTITAYGGQGGGDTRVTGGRGAQAGGTFEFAAGQELTIIVGGAGVFSGGFGSGGGGSFVFGAGLANPFVAAGGGGGAIGFRQYSSHGRDSTILGGDGSGGRGGNPPGLYYSRGSIYGGAGGGAGWNGDGQQGYYLFCDISGIGCTKYYYGAVGGSSRPSFASGGTDTPGGFGGGGAAFNGGAGGGGFTGGNGGWFVGGGAGTSYILAGALNPVFFGGVREGNGLVFIDAPDVTGTPAPGALGLVGAGAALAAGAVRLRRRSAKGRVAVAA